jgi:hypothetical protein
MAPLFVYLAHLPNQQKTKQSEFHGVNGRLSVAVDTESERERERERERASLSLSATHAYTRLRVRARARNTHTLKHTQVEIQGLNALSPRNTALFPLKHTKERAT